MNIKRMAALVGAGALAAGGLVALTALPAAAHTGDLHASAVCNTETGQYDVTYTLTLSSVPNGLTGSTMWRVGGSGFDGTPSSASGMDRGPVASAGNETLVLGTESIPGNSTTGPWVYAFTDWGSYDKGSDGRVERLAGDCSVPEPPFPGVEKYTPTYASTCEAATFSHPAIKTGFGIANVYGVRYGATQAEAQAKSFEPYTPGDTVTYAFADKYVGNSFYFELKVGYDGQTLTHQIGQTKGTSTPCERPTPNSITTSHVQYCGAVDITLRNVSPWIYPVSVVIDGVHSYGPTVDNRTDTNGDGKLDLNGPQKDASKTRTITFPEDSGIHTVSYRVDAGSENKLYKGLPVGEWTELTIDSDCIPPQPEDLVVPTEWVDGEYECGDETVTQTRTVTTSPYVLVEGEWVLDTENAVTTTETQDRDLTDAEKKVLDCKVTPPPTPEEPVAALTATGSEPLYIAGAIAALMILAGLVSLVRTAVRRR